MVSRNSHLGALDSFRGIAALSVVVFHLSIVGAISEWEFFRHSHLFVPFFFVLSGFVIAYVYDKASFSMKNFMIARSFRILPLYYVLLFAFLILECLKYVLYHKLGIFNNTPFSDKNGIEQILPNILLLQSWLSWTYPLSFNAPAWSLSVEWYLYILFGLAMFAPRLMRYSIVLLCVVGAYLHWFGFLTNESISGILHFGSGMLIYLMFSLCKNKNLAPLTLTLLELCALVVGIWVVYSGAGKYAVLAFSALILVFALSSHANIATSKGGGLITFVLESKPLFFFGTLSYSIYISHSFVIALINIPLRFFTKYGYYEMKYIGERFYIDFHNPIFANLYLVLNLCIVVLVAYVLHKYIEQPCIAFGKKLCSKSK